MIMDYKNNSFIVSERVQVKKLKKLIVLYVEDEEKIIEKYAYFLKEYCHTVHVARDGEEAYALYKEHKPHLIVMDLLIPKLNGVGLAKKIRAENDAVAMIALTAYSDREILLNVVDLNFSSYLIKPVGRADLIQALVKVSNKIYDGRNIYLPHDCIWDTKSQTLFCNDVAINLTKRELKFFELLVQRGGIPCNDAEILFHVWEDEEDKSITNASIRTLVKNLRKKIPKNLIKNQYGVGYKIDL
jgi:DNA-binding response OmpR family regulator